MDKPRQQHLTEGSVGRPRILPSELSGAVHLFSGTSHCHSRRMPHRLSADVLFSCGLRCEVSGGKEASQSKIYSMRRLTIVLPSQQVVGLNLDLPRVPPVIAIAFLSVYPEFGQSVERRDMKNNACGLSPLRSLRSQTHGGKTGSR